MWFKNLQIYRLDPDFNVSPEQLQEKLRAESFKPVGSLATSSIGWVSPFDHRDGELVYAAGSAMLLCARREERLLPSTVVNEKLKEKVIAIEETEGRPVRRKERMSLKDDIVVDLLPKAFTRSTYIDGLITADGKWLVINAASAKRAEEMVNLLRESLGSFKAQLPQTRENPATVMSQWLGGNGIPGDIELGDECELREPGESGGVVRCRKVELLGEEVQTHLAAGKRAAKVALTLGGRLHFVLTDELGVRRLTFDDVVQEEMGDMESADQAALFDAQFALMSLELGRTIPHLMNLFGGLNDTDND